MFFEPKGLSLWFFLYFILQFTYNSYNTPLKEQIMKVIIDFIEDVRESIGNNEDFVLTVMLLKEDINDASKMVYAGESPLRSFSLKEKTQELSFKIDTSSHSVQIGDVIPSLLILGMEMMMYELKIDVNAEHKNVEIIGFGKNEEEKKYILFITL
jgi:hypothetical protein